MSDACFLLLRPRAIVVRGVHRGPFGQQQLHSRDVALGRRQVQRRSASGAFSRKAVGAAVGFRRYEGAEADAPWMTNGSGGNAELYTGSTDKER